MLRQGYLFGLESFGPLLNNEGNTRSFIQTSITGRLDRREVDEDIFAILAGDESKALRSIKPLYSSSFFHEFSLSNQAICAVTNAGFALSLYFADHASERRTLFRRRASLPGARSYRRRLTLAVRNLLGYNAIPSNPPGSSFRGRHQVEWFVHRHACASFRF